MSYFPSKSWYVPVEWAQYGFSLVGWKMKERSHEPYVSNLSCSRLLPPKPENSSLCQPKPSDQSFSRVRGIFLKILLDLSQCIPLRRSTSVQFCTLASALFPLLMTWYLYFYQTTALFPGQSSIPTTAWLPFFSRNPVLQNRRKTYVPLAQLPQSLLPQPSQQLAQANIDACSRSL